MKNNTTKIASIGLGALLLLSNCKKAEQGPKGDTGAQGTAGLNGNANVKSSIHKNVPWSYDSDAIYYLSTIPVPAITQEIVNNGSVLVYIEIETGEYAQMPITIAQEGGANQYASTFFFSYSLGIVRLYIQDTDLQQPLNPGNSYSFKVVVLSAAAKGQKPTHPTHVSYDNLNN